MPILRLLSLPHREKCSCSLFSLSLLSRLYLCYLSLAVCSWSWLSLWPLLSTDILPLAFMQGPPRSVGRMQGSELEFRLCSVRNWIASFADLLLLAYRWTSFCAVSGLDPPKGARRHLSTDCHLFPTAGPLFLP